MEEGVFDGVSVEGVVNKRYVLFLFLFLFLFI